MGKKCWKQSCNIASSLLFSKTVTQSPTSFAPAMDGYESKKFWVEFTIRTCLKPFIFFDRFLGNLMVIFQRQVLCNFE
jgi:hypothetical protein